MATPLKRVNEINGTTVALYLDPSPRPPELSSEAIDESITEIAESAQRRLVINQSGGLPGPEMPRPSFWRRTLNLLDRFRFKK